MGVASALAPSTAALTVLPPAEPRPLGVDDLDAVIEYLSAELERLRKLRDDWAASRRRSPRKASRKRVARPRPEMTC